MYLEIFVFVFPSLMKDKGPSFNEAIVFVMLDALGCPAVFNVLLLSLLFYIERDISLRKIVRTLLS